jgi:hypothetical protein
MTTVRLALARTPPEALTKEPSPALLVSYAYWKSFESNRHVVRFTDYSLDSGAYTAWTSGLVIDVEEYADHCERLIATDPQCVEVFSLDVIGDWKSSMKNTEYLWARGIPAVPVYHRDDPEDMLHVLAKEYPKISLGGAVGLRPKAKKAWMAQCFARVYPKRIHGLGVVTRDILFSLPFDSVDASSWIQGPERFGSWVYLNGKASQTKIHYRDHKEDLVRCEVEYYMRLQNQLENYWAKDLEMVRGLE